MNAHKLTHLFPMQSFLFLYLWKKGIISDKTKTSSI